MKKNYINPQMLVVMMEQNLPIADSNPQANIDTEDDGIAPGSFGSKRRGSWDVWDEEED